MSLLFKQKKAVEKPAAARTKRPRRAAATSTKTYKEPETDDSQSEFEEILTPKAKTFSFILKAKLFYFSFEELFVS